MALAAFGVFVWVVIGFLVALVVGRIIHKSSGACERHSIAPRRYSALQCPIKLKQDKHVSADRASQR